MTSLAIISTIRQPIEQTRRFLSYHRSIGVRHFVLFFDDPHDPALPHLGDLEDVTCFNCDQQYWANAGTRPEVLTDRQKVNNSMGVAYCRGLGIRWAALIDGDELLYSESRGFPELDRANDDVCAIALLPFEAVHDRNSIEGIAFAQRHFKSLPNRWNRFLYRWAF